MTTKLISKPHGLQVSETQPTKSVLVRIERSLLRAAILLLFVPRGRASGFTLPRCVIRFDTYDLDELTEKWGNVYSVLKVKNSVSLVSRTLTIVSNSSGPGFSKDG